MARRTLVSWCYFSFHEMVWLWLFIVFLCFCTNCFQIVIIAVLELFNNERINCVWWSLKCCSVLLSSQLQRLMLIRCVMSWFCCLDDEQGKSALTTACKKQFISIAVFLIAAGAEVHQYIILHTLLFLFIHKSTKNILMWCVMVRVVRQQWNCWEVKMTRSNCVMLDDYNQSFLLK